MQISRSELSLLRLSDGIASAADIERLGQQNTVQELEAWRNVCRVVRTCLAAPEGERVDVADDVLAEIVRSPETTVRIKAAGVEREMLTHFLTDAHEIDVSDNVMRKLGLLEPNSVGEIIPTVYNSEDEKSGLEDVDTIVAQESNRQHSVDEQVEFRDEQQDDWSLSSTLRSALLDTNIDGIDLTSSIMMGISGTTESRSSQVDEGILNGDFSSTDSDVLAALEHELNNDSEEQQEPEHLRQASSMSFEHEIPSPVIANTSQSLDGADHDLVVEFTEEEEFLLPESAIVREFEEDSDEELCSVDEGFVTVDMLNAQSENLIEIRELLLDGKQETINIWPDIEREVNAPPLRLLRDVSEIEVVDKIPLVEENESNNVGPANVEFLNSKSIDADSTISKVSITVLGSFLTLAAAWIIIVLPSLLTQTTSTINTPKRIVTFEVAEVNQLEVEDLEVGTDMNVQILQGDANAPTIIFLDDMNMEPL